MTQKMKILNLLEACSTALIKTFDASYVLTNKSGKIVAKFNGGKHKGSKTCVWYPKFLYLMPKDPKQFGYLKPRTKLVL
jgi:hypothetical protein